VSVPGTRYTEGIRTVSWFFGPHRQPTVRRLLPVALLLWVGHAHPSAHNVTPEPTVEVFLRPAGDHLAVQLRLPTVALTDANLPITPDGHFVQGEIGAALDLVARGIARDLELEQGADLLPPPTVATMLSPDESSVTIDLDYVIRPDRTDFSARFHMLRNGGRIIRTLAHYVVSERVTRTFVISDNPRRVMFDPGIGPALQHFLAEGTETLLNGTDFLLFVLCVIAAARPRGRVVSGCAAFLAGQSITIVLASAGLLPATPAVLMVVQAAAASAIVVAAIQALVNPQSRWLPPLAFGVGLMSGVTIGTRLLDQSAFAGSHLAVAVLACLLLVSVGQIWVIALLSSATGLIRRRGATAELAVLAVPLFAGHQALHRLLDHSQALADMGSVSLDRFLVTLTLVWAAAILSAGILDVVLSTRFRPDGVSAAAENN
jgi:HupE/UreJ protein